MVLLLKNVCINYKKRQVLNDISFSVKDNEVLTLFGPSGVGKTTLLKLIAGILKPSEGEICFTEADESESSPAILVYQDFLLFPHMTVFDNVAFGLKNRRLSREIIKRKVSEVLENFELSDLADRYPDELSGGQKQRVALARAIILSPKLLLLDEPFSSLDGNLKVKLRDYLLSLKERYQFSMILVTHDKNEAFLMSDQVAVILDGKLAQIGRPKEVYDHPQSREVADLIGDASYLRGELVGNVFYLAGKKLEVIHHQQVNGPADLHIPYNMACIFGSSDGLPVKVERIYWQLTGTQTLFRLSDGQAFVLQNLKQELQEGQKVLIKFADPLQAFPL